MRRAVITGMGVVSPLGHDLDQFWARLVAGERGVRKITRFDTTGMRNSKGGTVEEFRFDPAGLEEEQELDEALQFALAASGAALRDAGLEVSEKLAPRAGVIHSTNFGGAWSWERFVAALDEDQPEAARAFRQFGFGLSADLTARLFNLRGPRAVMSISCASGGAALGRCLDLIRHDRADVMLAGGHDALAPSPFAGLSILRTITTDDIRPFDKDRSGTLFGEGAAVLVVEELEHARARGARAYCELAGSWQNNNAYHMTAPDAGGAGMARVVRWALADAEMRPDQIDYINAHGTGTEYHDPAETEAIKTVLGKRAYQVPVSSIKGALGHMMGAAGTVEAIATALAIHRGVVPPTANLSTPDEACDLDYVSGQGRECDVQAGVSISAGLGGSNSAVVLKEVPRE